MEQAFQTIAKNALQQETDVELYVVVGVRCFFQCANCVCSLLALMNSQIQVRIAITRVAIISANTNVFFYISDFPDPIRIDGDTSARDAGCGC